VKSLTNKALGHPSESEDVGAFLRDAANRACGVVVTGRDAFEVAREVQQLGERQLDKIIGDASRQLDEVLGRTGGGK